MTKEDSISSKRSGRMMTWKKKLACLLEGEYGVTTEDRVNRRPESQSTSHSNSDIENKIISCRKWRKIEGCLTWSGKITYHLISIFNASINECDHLSDYLAIPE